MITIIPFI